MSKLKTAPSANAPTVAVQRLVELDELLESMEIPTESLEQTKDDVAAYLDGLPIDYRVASRKGIKFFALVGGYWWPAHEGQMIIDEDDPLVGGLRWRMLADNGSEITAGVSTIHEWANAAADGTVDYHWLAKTPA